MIKGNKKLLTLLVICFTSLVGRAFGASFNQFEILAETIDDRYDSKMGRNCTADIDAEVAIVHCENGYFTIRQAPVFLGDLAGLAKTNDTTLDLIDTPKDVRLDKFITLVDERGLALTIIRRSTREVSQIGLDTSAGGVPPEILGGQISPDFVVIYISYAGKRFIQVHMAKTSLKLVGVLDSEILNYQVLDLVIPKDMFYVFAI